LAALREGGIDLSQSHKLKRKRCKSSLPHP